MSRGYHHTEAGERAFQNAFLAHAKRAARINGTLQLGSLQPTDFEYLSQDRVAAVDSGTKKEYRNRCCQPDVELGLLRSYTSLQGGYNLPKPYPEHLRNRRRKSRSPSSRKSEPGISYHLEHSSHIDPAVVKGLLGSRGSARSGSSARSKSTQSVHSRRSKSTRSRSNGDARWLFSQRPKSACSNETSSKVSEQRENQLPFYCNQDIAGYQPGEEENQLLLYCSPGGFSETGEGKKHPVGHLRFRVEVSKDGKKKERKEVSKDRRCSNPELSTRLNQLSQDNHTVGLSVFDPVSFRAL